MLGATHEADVLEDGQQKAVQKAKSEWSKLNIANCSIISIPHIERSDDANTLTM